MSKPTRMEQLGNLLTAMIMVVLSGSSDLLLEADISAEPTGIADVGAAAQLYRTRMIRSIQSRIAKQLGVSRCHVSLVANGRRVSKKVTAALAEEYARIERKVQRFERRNGGAA